MIDILPIRKPLSEGSLSGVGFLEVVETSLDDRQKERAKRLRRFKTIKSFIKRPVNQATAARTEITLTDVHRDNGHADTEQGGTTDWLLQTQPRGMSPRIGSTERESPTTSNRYTAPNIDF